MRIEYRGSSNIQSSSRIIQGIGDDINIHKMYTNVRLNNYLIIIFFHCVKINFL